MTSHRIDVQLTDEAFAVLQNFMQSGLYDSESDAIQACLFETHFQTRERSALDAPSPWTDAEVQAAIDEDNAHPEEALTVEQVREHFGIPQRTLVEAA